MVDRKREASSPHAGPVRVPTRLSSHIYTLNI
jgi:hypothetical protein